jgi:hypothetical protein
VAPERSRAPHFVVPLKAGSAPREVVEVGDTVPIRLSVDA